MELRYDFGDKLDLSKFRKQLHHFISVLHLEEDPQLHLHVYVKYYKIYFLISQKNNSNEHSTLIRIFDYASNLNGDIISYSCIVPSKDLKLKSFSDIINLFQVDCSDGLFNSNSVDYTIRILCKIINICSKINSLKVFL